MSGPPASDLAGRLARLSPAKRELLERRLREQGEKLRRAESIPRRADPGTAPLSFAQQRLWFLHDLAPESSVYNVPRMLRFRGTLDEDALRRALDEIVARHEVLRTTFVVVENRPTQVIAERGSVPLLRTDLISLPSAAREEEAARIAEEEQQGRFDLARGRLLRARLLRLGPEEHILLLTSHHIVSDAWSAGILLRELEILYRAFSQGRPSPLPRLPIQYADFAVWQREWLSGKVLESQLEYWRKQLEGSEPGLELPTDRPRPLEQSFRGGRHSVSFSKDLLASLKRLSQQEGATLYMTLLAAFGALLLRYTGQEDIAVGSPIAGRNRPEIEGLIGFFVNTLVLRTDLSGDPTFRELLHRVREVALNAYTHQDLPFEKLVEELAPKRDLGANPLFQVLFALQDAPSASFELPGLQVVSRLGETGSTHFDLEIYLWEESETLTCKVVYAADLFDPGTIVRMVEHYGRLLENVAANPDRRLSALELMSDFERHQVLTGWNDPAAEYRCEATLSKLFEDQVERTPESEAVVFGQARLTYRELNERANRLARYLRARGVGPEFLVGICVERSLEMVVGLLGILKAGGAYVPLDPSYPRQRLAFMLEDTQAPVVLTQASLLESLGEGDFQRVRLDADWPEIAQESVENLPSQSTPENLAYVIYTSGSTGTPKGVAIEHGSVVNLLLSMQERLGLGQGDILLAITTLSFDIAALELYLPLIAGACVAVCPRESALDGKALEEELRRCGATVMQATPASWRLLLDAGWDGGNPRTLLCGGEALPRELADHLLEKSSCVWNLYGPTETAIWSTAYRVEADGRPVSVGMPLANTRIRILDRQGGLVPVGVPGELYIGGAGLARGYWRRPELTAERFVEARFHGAGEERLYRTGDRARYRSDGQIEYLGRLDDQVKIRGYRIEIGEIEEALTRHLEVRACAVVARQEEAGDKRLVGYVVKREGTSPSVTQLREFLKKTLPDYMIPSTFVFLEVLPLTPSGKVDRKALPAPEGRPELEGIFVAPRDPIEEVLAGMWEQVLGVERVGVEDDFFALGGHSLLATQVISRIRDAFDVELPLRSLFEAPSVAGLARKISSARRQEAGSPARLLLPAPRDREFLSFAQQRLWFLDQLEPGNPFYTTSRVVRLMGDLDVDALQEAFAGVVARHESLRTRFESVDGRPVQIIEENVSFGLSVVDLGGLQQKDREATIARRVAKDLSRPFDLALAPLLRATLWRLSKDEHVLLVSTHHIVSDAWSMGILVKELAALYEESRGGVAGGLPRLPVQYADFARWQRERLSGEVLDKQLSYWRKQLAGMAPKLELPTDRPRPPAQSFRGDRRSVSLPKNLVTALTEISRREGTTLYMTLLAAFQTLLFRYTGQEDVVVGSPIAGRNRAEIEGLIGFFVNTLVLRTDLSGDPSFRELLRRVRDVALGAYDHQDLPFEKLVEDLDPERDLGANPLFQIFFALQNAPETPFELAGLRVMPLPVESRTTRFDLEVHLWEKPDGLTCTFVYATDLFDSGTIVRMMGHYQNLLEEIVRDADRQVSQLVILSERERRQVLEEWNRTAAEYPREATVPELFERQVEVAPQAEALVCGRERLTYAQLEERSNRLARYLSKLGVGPEVLVGLCLERSVEMVVGLLGILKAGAAYVPLDPSYPSKRLAFMLEDTGARVVLTQESLLGSLPAGDFRRVRLDADWGEIARESAEKLERRANSQNLAYVIYTSGSTGRPKGVAIEHRSTVALLAWAREAFSDDELGGVLASTSICFDLSVFELFAPLAWGGKVILAQNALELAQLPAAGEVKLVNTVPSAIGHWLRMGELPESVETVNLAGEPLAAALVREILRRGRVRRVLDLYGPTEDTTYSTCARRSAEGPATIGRPISNKRVYILDAHLGPVPVGVAGDLYVAGAGLARGYLNRPELTAQRFPADPFRAGQRMYQTGDRARFLADGSIQFLGRLDDQVKIRGYRIEIGEIEETLAEHPGIRACAAMARQDERGGKRLVAYIVPRDGEAPTVTQLRDYLKENLPDYMVPSVFLFLQSLPLTPNGKVDRQALPAPEQTRPELENLLVPPRNPVEETVTRIWCQVLGLEKVGIHDNFFELGGHSLLATRVFARLQKAFPIAPPLRTLFEKPTVAELSTAIEDLRQAGSGSSHSPVLPVSRQAQSPEPPDPVQEPSWTATTKGPLEKD